MYKLSDFDYHLPDEAIAQHPAHPRDTSKLMVIDRYSQAMTSKTFLDFASLLDDSYVVVRNNTKVIPARIYGSKTTGGKVELLLLKRIGLSEKGEQWEVMTKPGLKEGQEVAFTDSSLNCSVDTRQGYTSLVTFNKKGEAFFSELTQIGHTPIPPYIQWNEDDEDTLREVYQTIYAKHQGSAAAPTAGLHFTERVDTELIARGVDIFEVTLHVGLGTFLPVKETHITDHEMHTEKYMLSEQVAEGLNKAKQEGKKILSVGTTTTRLLESCVNEDGLLEAGEGETDIFIYPGYTYTFVDAILTNFHLPKSTLLMMISAFVSKPNTKQDFITFEQSLIGNAYQRAIAEEYRFYSFGDAMLIK